MSNEQENEQENKKNNVKNNKFKFNFKLEKSTKGQIILAVVVFVIFFAKLGYDSVNYFIAENTTVPNVSILQGKNMSNSGVPIKRYKRLNKAE